uniref:RxLR effector candidate protein n=1 Tax=Hyaloperonospora arabidopsidis (strain Emoy2) TaxID=559515 RepID=M4BL14_HYAAE|nr:RxLR effector candidate protein [Hyaloperonospora arabidopsidis Emoy2]
MRIYGLVFLTSTALSARADNDLEPAGFNLRTLHPSPAAPSLDTNDHDNSATTPSMSDGSPSNTDERISMDFLKSIILPTLPRVVKMEPEKSKEAVLSDLLQSLREDVPLYELRAKLKTREWKKLYKRYKGSETLLIEDLTRHFGFQRLLQVLQKGFEGKAPRDLLGRRRRTLEQKLAMDQLKSWVKSGKSLDQLFIDLNIADKKKGGGRLAETLLWSEDSDHWKVKVMKAYSNHLYTGKKRRSREAYLDAIRNGVGGEKAFFTMLQVFKRHTNFAEQVSELEDIYLRTCSEDKTNPVEVFKTLQLEKQGNTLFDETGLSKMEQYVEGYNRAVHKDEQTTVFAVLDKAMGEKLLPALAEAYKVSPDSLTVRLYAGELFESRNPEGKTVLSEEALLPFIAKFDGGVQNAIIKMYRGIFGDPKKRHIASGCVGRFRVHGHRSYMNCFK